MWWNRPVKTEPSSSELLVIAAIKPWACASCTAQFGRGNLLTMDDAGPLCMDCADLGHLEYLPRGDAALTRRAKRGSRLSAVVVQWSRARQRYERQGILAEVEAIAQAERECLADSEVRERRRERDARRRIVEDERFVAELADAIRSRFPGCSPGRAERIARHAGARSSGRIGAYQRRSLADSGGSAAGCRCLGPTRRHRLRGSPDERRPPNESAGPRTRGRR